MELIEPTSLVKPFLSALAGSTGRGTAGAPARQQLEDALQDILAAAAIQRSTISVADKDFAEFVGATLRRRLLKTADVVRAGISRLLVPETAGLQARCLALLEQLKAHENGLSQVIVRPEGSVLRAVLHLLSEVKRTIDEQSVVLQQSSEAASDLEEAKEAAALRGKIQALAELCLKKIDGLVGRSPAALDSPEESALQKVQSGDLYFACAVAKESLACAAEKKRLRSAGGPTKEIRSSLKTPAIDLLEKEIIARVRAFIGNISADPELVDAVQQALREKLIVADPEPGIAVHYDGEARLAIWARRVAKNLAVDILRRQNGPEIPLPKYDDDDDEDWPADPEALSPEETAILKNLCEEHAKDMQEALVDAFGKLTPQERVLLKLYYKSGHTQRRIAKGYSSLLSEGDGPLFKNKDGNKKDSVFQKDICEALDETREKLLESARQILQERIGRRFSHFSSAARAVLSYMRLHLSALLPETIPPDE